MSTRLARFIPFLAATVLSCTTFACSSATDGGETVGEDSDTQALLAGTRLSPADVADLLRDNGFPESAIGPMVCTAKYESSFYERASNHNHNGTTDYGLFQINSVHLGDSGCPDSASSLYDPSENTACAYRIWRSQGFNAWYGFQKHRSLCESYPAP